MDDFLNLSLCACFTLDISGFLVIVLLKHLQEYFWEPSKNILIFTFMTQPNKADFGIEVEVKFNCFVQVKMINQLI